MGVPGTRRITARLTIGGIVLLVAVGQIAFPMPVAAAPIDITTYAGGLGAGAATAIRQVPLGLGISGTKAYVVDVANAVVRVIDQTTGNETVIAGNGVTGFAGDGGSATSAQLHFDAQAYSPSGVAADSGGNVYISDTLNHRIRKVTPGGIISTIAGNGIEGFGGDSGAATQASLDRPAGLAFDSSGSLFLADGTNNRIRKITPAGIITTVAGGGTSGLGDGGPATAAQLTGPVGIYVDGSGNLFIAESSSYGRIRKVTAATGTITTVAGGGPLTTGLGDGGPATSAFLYNPGGVTFDATGNMYIADQTDQSIRKVTTDGIIHTIAGAAGWPGFSGDGGPAAQARLQNPTAVAFDGAGNLLIDDTGNWRVRRIDTAGIITTFAGNGNCGSAGDGGAATSAQLCAPSGLAVDATGNLYVADTGNGRVRKVTPAGVITTVAGGGNTNPGDGGPATAAFLNQPTGIALDGGGNLYIAETGNNRVRKVTAAGIITTLAGNGTAGFSGDGGAATSAQLNTPNAVAVDSGGNVFIADSANNRIREVTAAGIVSTFAGGGTAVPGDGGPATAASLANPSGVAIDAAGTLYIADTDRWSLQKVTPDGTISTIVPGNACCVWNVTGLAVTSSGYLLSAVPRLHQVSITGSSGALTVVAGTGSAGFAGDGGPATAAQLWSPTAVAVDAAGNRYIADTGNNRVRRVQAASPPGAPSNVSASPGAGFAFVSWTAPPDGGSPIGSYTIAPAVNGVAQTPTTISGTPPLTSATITGLTNKTYTFTVTASNDGGTGPGSAPSNAVTPYGSAATDCGVPIAVAAGADHRLVLKSNGAVWGWGNNYDGELGTGSTVSAVSPVPSQMTGAIAIAAGSIHSLALKSDGTVWGWGDNSVGQLGTGSTSAPSYAPVTTPVQVINLSGVIAIAAGGFHSLALKSDGTVWAWGSNASGELGNGTTTDSAVPVRVSGLSGVTMIAGGDAHSLALKSDGSVWGWGSNDYGQLGQPPPATPLSTRGSRRLDAPTTLPSLTRGAQNDSPRLRRAAVLSAGLTSSLYFTLPAKVPGLGTNVTAVAGGFWHSLALTSDGSVWTWGDNYYGELGTSVGQYDFVPPQAAAISGAVSIAGGRATSVATKADGTVWAWGYNWPTAPTQVGGIGAATMVADGQHQFLALDANSQVWEWGLRTIATPTRVTGAPNGVSQLATGGFHSVVLANGQIWAWGWNGDGQLGNGSMIGSASPVQTTGLPNIGGPIAAGLYYSLAVDYVRSSAWAWGDNADGELGLGTANYTSTDAPMPGGINPNTIAAGAYHTLETDNSNSTLAYGSNFYGQLGQPTSTARTGAPTAVPNFPNARSVAAGRDHSLAAFDAGRVYAWGYNLDGELGNGSTTSSSTPVQVLGLPSGQIGPALPVWAGAYTSFTMDESGNLYGWGYNGDGELGIGTTANSSTAVQIPGFRPTQLAPGAFHVLARKSDGTVWAWGDNGAGELGNGTAADSYSPAQVPGLTNVIAIAAGGNHSLALKQDGSLWQWGAVYTTTPVQVAGLINPVFPIVSGLSPTNGAIGGGTTVTISGRGLSGATGVSFGGVPATGFTVNSDSQITATAPAGKPGAADVTVSTSACASAAAASSRFTYGNLYSVASDRQYSLKGSNGVDWTAMDPRSLVLLVRPPANQSILLTANADLFTGTPGYNQDLGIFVSDNGGPDTLVGWKESGGYAGIFSPNAAYVQYLFNARSGHTYVFKLKWKTNISAPGATIYAGAGSGPYSLTSLVAQTFPAGVATNFAFSTSQYTLPSSDGANWNAIDGVNLSTTLTPAANATAVLGANADLWTVKAGYNQDFGIFVSDNAGPDTLVGWKESGGFAGTYSPNAAFVKAVYAMTAGHTYKFTLKWKTNRYAVGAGATIVAAAGSGPVYSQTSLLAETIAAGANPYAAVSTSQYAQANSDGATWIPIDAVLDVHVTPGADTNSIIGANADLWTATASFNQDIGIFVSDNGGPDVLLAWKESGGFAGTYSPNAAFVQTTYLMTAGHSYMFKLKWKTNKNAPGATIYAAAGGGPVYSQTRLTVEFTN